LKRAAFIILAVLISFLGIRWKSCLAYLGGFLIDSQAPRPADLIVVLGGDFWGPRVIQGADLAQAGYAPLVLFSGTLYKDRPEGEWATSFLVERGYPARLFAVFPHAARSTVDEATALRGELARRRVRRAILVTSSYHSRRAAMVLQVICPGIHFISVPAPDPHYDPDNWWNRADSRKLFFSEWTKILGFVLMAPGKYLLNR